MKSTPDAQKYSRSIWVSSALFVVDMLEYVWEGVGVCVCVCVRAWKAGMLKISPAGGLGALCLTQSKENGSNFQLVVQVVKLSQCRVSSPTASACRQASSQARP